MSASNKCTNCGSLDLDTDPARGDVVCTSCGTVLEHSAIVAEIQFEENAHGGSSAIGQFVSSDSKGGARGFGRSFHTGLGKESREITQQNAKKSITILAGQLQLKQVHIDQAFNWFKMALSRQLTRGRRSTHVIAACLYMTCRLEGTPHMLIDFSDVLQIDVYELGRTYLRLSQALSLSIPSLDPCIYIVRFAHRLDFGPKTHEVGTTAIRLVKRMKRDSIHTGRRPSGLCGAAILIAARLHEFNRTIDDVIKIVKVHESTLRKRLMEFGETPSSALTLDEFMNVDLEEEQDPPSFKAARKKDRDRLQKLMEENDVDTHLSQLQHEIERQLEERKARSKRFSHVTKSLLQSSSDRSSGTSIDEESAEADRFATQSTLGVIRNCIDSPSCSQQKSAPQIELGPSIASMGLLEDSRANTAPEVPETPSSGEIDLDDIDDNEIDSYIMSEQEALNKDTLWVKVNADYLKELKEKEEKAKRDLEEGKPEKKKRKSSNKKGKGNQGGASGSAGEAVQKMLQEKKMSSKLNYDVLKNLSVDVNSDFLPVANTSTPMPNKRERADSMSETTDELPEPVTKVIKTEKDPKIAPTQRQSKKPEPAGFPIPSAVPETPVAGDPEEADEAEDYDDLDTEEQPEEQSMFQLLNQHRGEDDYGNDYDYEEY